MTTKQKHQTVPYIHIDEQADIYQISQTLTGNEIIDIAKSILSKRCKRGQTFSCPQISKEYALVHFADFEREYFICIFLDNKLRLIDQEVLFQGTIDGAQVSAREIVKRALHHNAANVLLAHNHPSGDPAPSHSDKAITKHIIKVLDVINVNVIDHLIVGSEEVISLAEMGEIP